MSLEDEYELAEKVNQMSETETRVVTLTPTGKTVDEYMDGKTMPDYYDNLTEWFRDECYEVAIEINGQIYEIAESEPVSADIFQARRESDGKISYVLQYYNGSCSFNEAIIRSLKQAIKKMES